MSKKEKVADEKSDEVSPTKINKYDPYSLKDAIDQQIISVPSLAHLPQALEKKGFSESHKYINIKILLAFIGVSFGVASHFYPIPFPQNIPLLILCIVGYVLIVHAHNRLTRVPLRTVLLATASSLFCTTCLRATTRRKHSTSHRTTT